MEMINYVCMIAFTVPDGDKRRRVEAEIEVKFRAGLKRDKQDRCKRNKDKEA